MYEKHHILSHFIRKSLTIRTWDQIGLKERKISGGIILSKILKLKFAMPEISIWGTKKFGTSSDNFTGQCGCSFYISIEVYMIEVWFAIFNIKHNLICIGLLFKEFVVISPCNELCLIKVDIWRKAWSYIRVKSEHNNFHPLGILENESGKTIMCINYC